MHVGDKPIMSNQPIKPLEYDIVIIGGGPGGSTVGTLLKKYNPDLKVLILEREKFPRNHVGESQLPVIGKILAEMGCWDKVEAAEFPIKIGAVYRWGLSPNLWSVDFVPVKDFKDEPRPAHYVGQRERTAFQVERDRYDQILLTHALEMGCEVREETMVSDIQHKSDAIEHITLKSGEQIKAKYYVDASGNAAIIRRKLNIGIFCPSSLKNVAFWDYWQNARWAEKIGVGGTRVWVMSIGTGWLWFIPLSPTRTSIGFVCPLNHYKQSKKTPKELYFDAISQEKNITKLIQGAECENDFSSTKDWSFIADRMAGKNWFLCGEAAGFADPILAAGLALTHTGARELAYTILALEKGEHEANWLKGTYEDNQKRRINQHILFADFWYLSNRQFTDLQKYSAEIAAKVGLDLSPEKAFLWLGTGGFTDGALGNINIGAFDLSTYEYVTQKFTKNQTSWQINHYSHFELDLSRAKEKLTPQYEDGIIKKIKILRRDQSILTLHQVNILLVNWLHETSSAYEINAKIQEFIRQPKYDNIREIVLITFFSALEIMLLDKWVRGKTIPNAFKLNFQPPNVTIDSK